MFWGVIDWFHRRRSGDDLTQWIAR